MKTISLGIRQKFSETMLRFDIRKAAVDWIVIIEFAAIVALIFFKVFIHGQFVAERSRIESLRSQIKNIESETQKIKVELGRYKDREMLRDISEKRNLGENIELVVVRQ